MKQLISATLSKEAAEIYNSWAKQKKSEIISKMICSENTNILLIEALRKKINHQQTIIAKANIKIFLDDPSSPLSSELNDVLEGTIHYQYRN
ncbi:MAG: hypothetical protein [Circular genetic element sp.]|nr:MAG: hypothetical protein [Circular genetic element sp.]